MMITLQILIKIGGIFTGASSGDFLLISHDLTVDQNVTLYNVEIAGSGNAVFFSHNAHLDLINC